MVDTVHYLDPVLSALRKQWPSNKAVNIVCHGHSVPAGYYMTPVVNSLGSYPHLLHRILAERFPFAVINVIVSAEGGENSVVGAKRFQTDALNHNPAVVTIDYGLNDRGFATEKARGAWKQMIEEALEKNAKVILLTPNWDTSYFEKNESWTALERMTGMIRELAEQYGVGLADTFKLYQEKVKEPGDLVSLLSSCNHPNAEGHKLIADELGKYFLAWN